MSKKRKKHSKSTIIFLSFCVLIAVIFLYAAIESVKEKQAWEACSKIEKDPQLMYPCKCYPTNRPLNESDYIESRTNTFCTCTCDIGNGNTYTVEIRVTK